MRYVIKGLGVVVVLALLLVLGAWLFLSSSLFATPRAAIVENVLSNKLGQTVKIDDDVRVSIGRVLEVEASGLSLPSTTMPDEELARIDILSFEVPANSLWKGQLTLGNLQIDGVHMRLLTDQDGMTSWKSTKPPTDKDEQAASPAASSVGDILEDRRLHLSNVTILYQNALNGLEFDLQMGDLNLIRADAGAPAALAGSGILNGEAFDLTGTFPRDEPFQATLGFEHLSITANQVAGTEGLEVAMSAEIVELGQLLDTFALNRVLEGSGALSANFKSAGGVTRLDDLDVQVDLDTGQSLQLTGQLGELGNPSDVSLTTRIRLYPEGAEPAPAQSRYDLKLVAVDMVMDSVPGQVPQRQMVIETNGFTLDTSGEGPPPVQFSDVSRTPDGALRVGNVNLRIGPPSDPFIILNGSVEDALRLDGVSADGFLEIPASSLIAPELLGPDDPLGTFSGEFHLDGNIQSLSLTNLDGQTDGTDLWDLNVQGTVENVLKFHNLDLGIDISVPSGADLLAALSLEPVDTGRSALSVRLASEGPDWNADANIALAESNLRLTADLDDATNDPVLRGKIESDLIQIAQIRGIVQTVAQFRRLGTGNAEEEALVETEGSEESGALRDVTLKPLGRSILLSGMDMDIDIDLRHIEGAKGVSSLQSEVTLIENELRAGPLAFEYGGAKFDVNGFMDLSGEARLLTLSGTASGWQLDDILGNLDFKKGASGTIWTDFDVTGGTDSVKDFVASMSGNATVSMRNGSIETQLLDIAGLGVLPWVFSKDKKKVAPIVCLRAPLVLSNGTISTKQTTVETDQVQVVVFGNVDLGNKVLDLNIQPRRIGKPLSRSPWPVTATGALADPKIKVKDGPKKLKRSDGADKMPAKRKLCVPDILQLQ
ncbi:MAG: AsmA family protein [Ruegeria sp.]